MLGAGAGRGGAIGSGVGGVIVVMGWHLRPRRTSRPAADLGPEPARPVPRGPPGRERRAGRSRQREGADDEPLALEVEDGPLAPPQQLEQGLGVLGRRAQHVLVGPVVEDQVEGEGPRRGPAHARGTVSAVAASRRRYARRRLGRPGRPARRERSDAGTGPARALARARDPQRVARALRRVSPAPPAAALARLRKAVCDPARLGLLRALGAGPLTVDDLALVIGRAPPATSQHLRVLRELGLVEGRRRGTAVHYRLRPGPATDDVLAAARRLAQGAREAPAAGGARAGAAR